MHIHYSMLWTFRFPTDTVMPRGCACFMVQRVHSNLFWGMIPVPLRYSTAGQAGAGHYGHLGVTLGPINNLEGQ